MSLKDQNTTQSCEKTLFMALKSLNDSSKSALLHSKFPKHSDKTSAYQNTLLVAKRCNGVLISNPAEIVDSHTLTLARTVNHSSFTTQIVLNRSGDTVWCETRASKATVWSQSGDCFGTCWITTKYMRRKWFQEKRHNQEKIFYCLSRPVTDTLKSMFPRQTGRRHGFSLGANIRLNIS